MNGNSKAGSASSRTAGSASDQVDVVIHVRNPHCGDTHIARAQGYCITASSTSSGRVAAERCAAKVFGHDHFTLRQYGHAATWIARAMKANSATPSTGSDAAKRGGQ